MKPPLNTLTTCPTPAAFPRDTVVAQCAIVELNYFLKASNIYKQLNDKILHIAERYIVTRWHLLIYDSISG